MSLIPNLFAMGNNRSSSIFDPYSTDVWNHFEGSPFNASVANRGQDTSGFITARVDWEETPELHVFKADVPGLKKDEVKVEVEEGRVLQIRGERSIEREQKNNEWHRMERSRGKFVRRFRLPESANVREIKAAMEDGVLTVTVPKGEEKKHERLTFVVE